MNSILQVLGGLGLFLLGMSLMTEGLKALAGGSLRRALARFTKSPTSGAVTGAIATAIVQSSSITVLTAVGFVGARLLTFPQALGVIYGANIGTTLTGWIVVLVGFKGSLDQAMLPLVFAGALLHLFGRGRWAKIGYAIAGFALIFVGITMLQSGMAAAEQFVSPQSFPENNLLGRLQLVLMGCAITVVTQSSSAGVATAIAAVSAGAISFPQAAALVIGMDVGTTVTAALATLGGNTAVRRTGLSHVVYNLLTAGVAFAALSPYVWAVESLFPSLLATDPEISLVGFHTFFNALGVALVLPFANQFAALIERVFPEDASSLTRHLSASQGDDEFLSLCAVHSTLLDISRRAFEVLHTYLLRGDLEPLRLALDDLGTSVASVDSYLSKVQTTRELGMANEAHLDVLHALEHLRMLLVLCQHPGLGTPQAELQAVREVAAAAIAQASACLGKPQNGLSPAREQFQRLEGSAKQTRRNILKLTASGQLSVEQSSAAVERTQWVATVGSHADRLQYHLRDFPLAGDRQHPSV